MNQKTIVAVRVYLPSSDRRQRGSVMDTAASLPARVLQPPDAQAAAIKRLRWAWPVAIVVGIPIAGYASNIIVGNVDAVGAALLSGLITGAIIGAAQWWALRLFVSWVWIVATSVGMTIGLTAGAALVDYGISRGDLALMGAVTGLAVAGLQAVEFARHGSGRGHSGGSPGTRGFGALGLVRDHVRNHQERQGAVRGLRCERRARLRAADLDRPDVLASAERARDASRLNIDQRPAHFWSASRSPSICSSSCSAAFSTTRASSAVGRHDPEPLPSGRQG